jgi:hypothetical protein
MSMAFDDRLQFLILGMLIGFVLGYVVRLLTDIKEELDDVRDDQARRRGEAGFMRHPIAADFMVLLVVAISVYASFVSQQASNNSQNSQASVEKSIACTIKIQGQALTALNERSTYTKATADANIDLQQSQADFFGLLLHKPPFSEARRSKAAESYFEDLQQFLVLAKAGAKKVAENPFPTVKDLRSCLGEEQ